MKKIFFIDGLDCCGKTTLINNAKKYYSGGREGGVAFTTMLSSAMPELRKLFNVEKDPLIRDSYAKMMCTDTVLSVIPKLLLTNDLVVVDRSLASLYVYQGEDLTKSFLGILKSSWTSMHEGLGEVPQFITEYVFLNTELTTIEERLLTKSKASDVDATEKDIIDNDRLVELYVRFTLYGQIAKTEGYYDTNTEWNDFSKNSSQEEDVRKLVGLFDTNWSTEK